MRDATEYFRLIRSTITAARLLALAGFAIACQEEGPLTGPAGAVVPSTAFAISDAANGGMRHFFLLPPLAPQPVPTGRFDPNLAPTVEICALDRSACGAIIATFTRASGPGGEKVRVDAEREWYEVNWRTREFSLRKDVHYRILVRVGAAELGYVDVIDLPPDGTLPIRFRAEEGVRSIIEAVNTGKLAFVSDRSGNFHIYTMTGSGLDLQKLTNGSASHRYPAWSPNGTRIVYERELNAPFQYEIWVMNWDGSGKTNLSNANNQFGDGGPVWSPDGSRIAFYRTFYDVNQDELFVMNADGTGKINLSEDSLANDWDASWSPDGTRIAFLKGSLPHVINADGTGTATALAASTSCGSSKPAWSPSGDQIAVTLDCDIWVVEPDGSGLTNLSNNPALESDPQWAPDGSKLYFLRETEEPVLGDFSVWAMNPDGTGQQELASTGAFGASVRFDVRSDGEWLAFTNGDGNTWDTWEIFKIASDGTGEVNLTNAEGRDYMPDWRP